MVIPTDSVMDDSELNIPDIPVAIQHTVAVTSDNASNITKAIKDTEMHHIRCFAHSLNLSAQKFTAALNDPISRVRAIVKYFHNIPRADSVLKVS